MCLRQAPLLDHLGWLWPQRMILGPAGHDHAPELVQTFYQRYPEKPGPRPLEDDPVGRVGRVTVGAFGQ